MLVLPVWRTDSPLVRALMLFLDLGRMSCHVFLEEKSALKDEWLHVLSYRMPQI